MNTAHPTSRLETSVAIVGAGTAGCALALALRRHGVRVALLDRCVAPDFRVGETLPPNVATRLRRLGLFPTFLALDPVPSYGVATAWGWSAPEPHSYFGHPESCGWVVDRAAFDEMLRSAAIQAGALLVAPIRVAEIDRAGTAGWNMRGVTAAGDVIVHARFVVDATGRGAACGVKIGARPRRLDRLVGLVWRFARGGGSEPTLVEATPGGWWYTAAVRSGWTIVVFLTDAGAARSLTPGSHRRRWPTPCLAEAALTAERLGDHAPQGPPAVFPAYTQTLEPAAGDLWLAIGDAAVGRDPISGSGVDFALASAEVATEAILRACGGDRSATAVYATLIRRDFAAYLDERCRVYTLERRWPDARFWRQRSRQRAEADA